MDPMDRPSEVSLRAAAKATLRYGIIGTAIALVDGFTEKLWEHAVLSWIDENISTEAGKIEQLKVLITHPFILAGIVLATWAIWIVVLAYIKDGRVRLGGPSETPEPALRTESAKIQQTITGSGNRVAGGDYHETTTYSHPKYSSRQVLHLSNALRERNDTLNLDNVATLHIGAP
jgi:hypothetical protein